MARGGLIRQPHAGGEWRRAFINTEFPRGPHGRDFRDGPDSGGAWLALAGFVGLPLLVGAADAAAVGGGLRGWYGSLAQPPGTPPDWVFGPVWTILYVLIGVAAWLVWRVRVGQTTATATATATATGTASRSGLRPLRLWGWQLLANAAWAPAFFGLHAIGAALLVMLPLLLLLAATCVTFWRVRRAAGLLLLPYLAWTCYAAYLTAGFWMMNPHP